MIILFNCIELLLMRVLPSCETPVGSLIESTVINNFFIVEIMVSLNPGLLTSKIDS